MIGRLFAPLKVDLIFDDRVYRLGETIDIRVGLTARNNLEVREGAVDLVFEERFTESEIVMVPSPGSSRSQMRRWLFLRGPASAPSLPIPKQVTETRKVRTVHSSVSFMESQRMKWGTVLRCDTRLKTDTEPPATTGTIGWKLVATLDLRGSPDVTGERTIRISPD